MQSTLAEHCRAFEDRSNVLIARFDVPLPSSRPFDSTCPPIHEAGQALLVVRLQSLWSSFCRGLIGISASHGATNVRATAKTVAREMGDTDPVWHKPEFVVGMANNLLLANAEQISLHVGASLTSGRLSRVRNYIVHPGSRTESRYREVAAAAGMPRADVGTLLNARAPGGATLFERWTKDLQMTAGKATE